MLSREHSLGPFKSVPGVRVVLQAHQHCMQQQRDALNPLQDKNLLDNPQPQHPLQQGSPMQTMRLTTEYLEVPRLFIQNMKREMSTTTIPSIPPVDVPVERQAEYLNLLDAVHARCLKLEPKLAIYLALFGKVNPIVGLAAIICTVAQQKRFEGARFIITLDMLQKMLEHLKRMTKGFGPEWAC